MKIIVKNEVGNPIQSDGEVLGYHTFVDGDLKFESAFFPAPGMPDGEHECELVWQLRANRDLVEAGIEKEIRWVDCNEQLAGELSVSCPDAFRQIWVLSVEPLKQQVEISGVKTFDEILQWHYIHDRGLNNPEYVKNAAFEFATQVAKAVRDECAKKATASISGMHGLGVSAYVDKESILNINISDFIK